VNKKAASDDAAFLIGSSGQLVIFQLLSAHLPIGHLHIRSSLISHLSSPIGGSPIASSAHCFLGSSLIGPSLIGPSTIDQPDRPDHRMNANGSTDKRQTDQPMNRITR